MNDFSKRTFIFYFVFGKNKVKNCNILNTKSPIKRSNISISKYIFRSIPVHFPAAY